MDTLRYLERLEALVDDSRKVLGFFRFDDEEFYMLVQQIRASLPEDVRKAGAIADRTDEILEAASVEAERKVLAARRDAEHARTGARSEADGILDVAKSEAERLLSEARARAEAMVSQAEVFRLAEAQAKALVAGAEADAETCRATARRDADEMREGADEYAREILAKLESRLVEARTGFEAGTETLLAGVRKGREALEPELPIPTARTPRAVAGRVPVGFSSGQR
ncbi:MAG: hypothetical protein ACKO5K_11375 [Armatimonadota bacterium]